MAVELAYDLWSEVKRYISAVDRSEAADTLVSILIDNDYDAEDIKSVFKSDPEVRKALSEYLDDAQDDEQVEDEYEDYEEDDSY